MNLRLLPTPLVAATLLLSTLGCSKKEDAQPTASTASYKLDGATITCQSKAYTSSATSGGLTTDYLQIHLTTTPEPASGTETLKLYYARQSGQGASSYVLTDATLFREGGKPKYYFATYTTTLSATSGGGFSGTFAAKNGSPAGTPPTGTNVAITDGTFTDARP
jgi:hypothetical protein